MITYTTHAGETAIYAGAFTLSPNLFMVKSTGFELWRTLGAEPQKDQWKLVIDKGAGDAGNERPWSLAVFKDYIYLGTAIEAAVLSLNPDQQLSRFSRNHRAWHHL